MLQLLQLGSFLSSTLFPRASALLAPTYPLKTLALCYSLTRARWQLSISKSSSVCHRFVTLPSTIRPGYKWLSRSVTEGWVFGQPSGYPLQRFSLQHTRLLVLYPTSSKRIWVLPCGGCRYWKTLSGCDAPEGDGSAVQRLWNNAVVKSNKDKLWNFTHQTGPASPPFGLLRYGTGCIDWGSPFGQPWYSAHFSPVRLAGLWDCEFWYVPHTRADVVRLPM